VPSALRPNFCFAKTSFMLRTLSAIGLRNMTPIEIMAFIAAIIVPIKIIMLLRSQKSWFNTVTRRFWGNAVVTTILSLIVVIVTLYYLLQELTIIQIWAVT
jgi:hypothetical protein